MDSKSEVVYVIRNLPFNLEKEKFSLSISTAFSEDTVKIIEYIQGKKGTKEIIPTRCYVKIFNKTGSKSSDSFLDFMDGKSFVNNKGIEEQCSVENVPFFLNVEQTKRNASMGTLESSKTYQSFLKQLDLPTDSVQNFDLKGNTTQESWPIVDMILRRDGKKVKREKKEGDKKKEKKKRKRSKRKDRQKQKLLQKQQESANTPGPQNISSILSPLGVSASNSSQNNNNSNNKPRPKPQPKEKQRPKEKKPRERKTKDKLNNNTNSTSATATATTTTTTTTTTTNTASNTPKSNKAPPKEKQFREKRQPDRERKPKLVFEPKIKQPATSNPPPST